MNPPTSLPTSSSSSTPSPPSSSRAKWSAEQTQALINVRKRRNMVNIWNKKFVNIFALSSFNSIQIIMYCLQEYHDIEGTSRVEFWNSVADDVNATCSSSYTGLQCQRKFASLTSCYSVSRILKKYEKYFVCIYINFVNTFRICD